MKPPDKEEILKIKFRRAKKSLQEAKLLYENSFYNASVSRLYYACFYAATTLLYNINVFTKTHSGVKQKLGQHYIKTGLISEKLGEFYTDILSSRLLADYDEMEETNRPILNEYLLLAAEFIDKAQKLINL